MAKYEISINGKIYYEVEIISDDGHRAVVKVDGIEYEVEARKVTTVPVPNPNAPVQISPPAGMNPGIRTPSPPASIAASPKKAVATNAGDLNICAPMPGVVLGVMVSVGQRVKPGEPVILIEAMKMENEIKSDIEGTIKEILVSKGDTVQEQDVLLVLEE